MRAVGVNMVEPDPYQRVFSGGRKHSIESGCIGRQLREFFRLKKKEEVLVQQNADVGGEC
jgi:hypothetical protein